jgi:hypothetical protein
MRWASDDAAENIVNEAVIDRAAPDPTPLVTTRASHAAGDDTLDISLPLTTASSTAAGPNVTVSGTSACSNTAANRYDDAPAGVATT